MKSTDNLLKHAQRCHNEGRFLAAADFLLEAFRGKPEDPKISCELGKVLRSVGDTEGAITYLKRAWRTILGLNNTKSMSLTQKDFKELVKLIKRSAV